MGVKTGLRPQRGVQKTFFALHEGVWPLKKSKKTLLTLKMIDSALENKHFLNLHKKLA